MRTGVFITFEGIDGCGKSTQLALLARRLRASGREVVETAEPGGTAIGAEIRRVLLDPASDGMDPRTEVLLYFASRAQNCAQIVAPALQKGAIVLCDRFTDSTLVYQGAGRGLPPEEICALDRIACAGLRPDLTLLLDIELATSLARARTRNEQTGSAETRMDDEGRAFFERVRDGYRELARTEPRRIISIDAEGPMAKVEQRIWAEVSRRV